MTPDERQMLSGLFDRIRGAATGPKDAEAEAFINDSMRQTPSAAYVMAQTVLVQQNALEAASRRIAELEQQAKAGSAPPPGGGSFLGNIGRSIFGSDAPAAAPAPRNNYDPRAYERPPEAGYGQRPAYAPPPPQAGPWGAQPQAAQGGGFLQGAMQTAAGVAGGVLLGNAIGGLFGGGHSGGLFGGGSAFAAPHETVNNYSETDPAGQHAQDVLQDMDQDQDAAQDSYDDSGSGGGGDDWT